MSGIKVYNTTGSAPNRILNIVCKEILDPHDRDDKKVESNNTLHPSVVPEPAYAQTTIDDFITVRDPSNGANRDIPSRTNLDNTEYMDSQNDDEEVNDDERIDQDDTTIDGGVIPRMPKGGNTGFDKLENMECDDYLFTASCPAIIDSQPTKNKSPQHQTTNKDSDDVMIVDFVPAADGQFRETLPNLPRHQRKATKTTNMIGDGNCFFR